MKITEASQQPQDEKETWLDLQNALTQGLTTTEQPSGSEQPGDVLAEAGPATTEMLSKSDNSDDVLTVVDGINGSVEPELAVMSEPTKSETAKGDTNEETNPGDKISQVQLECQDGD